MKISPVSNIRINNQQRPPVFKGNRELFKKTDEPTVNFKEILQELINPKDC